MVVLKFILEIVEKTFETYTKYSGVDDEEQNKKKTSKAVIMVITLEIFRKPC